MKKYVVINKTTREVFGRFDTEKEAGKHLLFHLNNHLSDVRTTEFLSPFDFDIKEEEAQGINNYEEAVEFLGIKDIYRDGEIKTVETTPKHYKALLALSKLFVIAEAWNKEDGFVPDFSNENQYKYFPWFEYNKGAAGFVCASTVWAATLSSEDGGSRLCFATRERAFDFGRKFEGLYNDFLLFA